MENPKERRLKGAEGLSLELEHGVLVGEPG